VPHTRGHCGGPLKRCPEIEAMSPAGCEAALTLTHFQMALAAADFRLMLTGQAAALEALGLLINPRASYNIEV